MNKKSKNMYLLKNTLLFTIGSFGTRFISLILVPLYTGVLDTAEYGIIDLVSTICAILVPVISMNIGEAIMRFSLDKDSDCDKIMKIGWVFMGICTIAGLLLYPVFLLFNSTKDYAMLISLYSISMGINQIAICNLRGKEQIINYSIASILNSAVAAGLNILFLVVFKYGITGYFTSFISANIITCIYSLVVGKTKGALKATIDLNIMTKMVQYSFFLIPTSLMWWIINSSDRIMVTMMVGVSANGIYAISYKIPTLISSITSIFNQAWSYSAIREKNSLDEEEYSNYIYNNMFSIMNLLGAVLLLIMKPFLSIYVSENYFEAWRYTPYLLIGAIFLTLATFLSTSYTVHKDSKGFLLSGLVGAIINVVLNILLIPRTGVTGAALATCISYISVYIFRIFHTKKYIRIRPFNKYHILGVTIIFIMSVTMFNDKYGNILLFFEFIVMVVIYRGFIYNTVKNFYAILLKKSN